MIEKKVVYKNYVYRVKAAMWVGDVFWIHVNGQTLAIHDAPKSAKRDSQRDKQTVKSVRAPMPGKILKVLVQPNESVKEKQKLVVMEAMKMEYSLAATHQSVIDKVLVSEGQLVELNQLLVELKD